MIPFGAFSTMGQDHFVVTAKDWVPTFRRKTMEQKMRVGCLNPTVDHLCPAIGKIRGGKYRLQ